MRFARLFEFTSGQLLLNITTDVDVDGFVLSLETYYQGSFVRTGLPFSTFSDASESMDEVTDQQADQLYQSLILAGDRPTIGRGKNEALEGFEDWIKNNPEN